MKIATYMKLNSEEIAELGCYVIVERWRRAVGSGASERHRIEYRKQFTNTERKRLSKLRGKFRRWYLVTGPPDKIMLKPSAYHLIKRAANFFSQI